MILVLKSQIKLALKHIQDNENFNENERGKFSYEQDLRNHENFCKKSFLYLFTIF